MLLSEPNILDLLREEFEAMSAERRSLQETLTSISNDGKEIKEELASVRQAMDKLTYVISIYFCFAQYMQSIAGLSNTI